MQSNRHVQAVLASLLTLLPSLAFSQTSNTIENVAVVDLDPNLVVFTTSTGNVVASVGPDGVLLVGTPSLESTAQISRMLSLRTRSPLRYVVIASEDPGRSEGDAGWQARGAFVAMQENALSRFGGHTMGAPVPLPQHLIQLGVDRPRISFSEVLSFDLNHESMHFIHQPGGSDDAQVLVHFHMANLLYFGEDFPGNSYPRIDVAHGGNLDGILNFTHSTIDSNAKIWVAGCGTTQAVYTALRFPLASITGSDLSPASLEITTSCAAALGLNNVTVRQESLNRVDYREEFDYIVSTGVIHHNAEPGKVLTNIARALRPNGVLELMVYNRFHRIFTTAFQKD